ncbi:MAG TPA: class I SAM-dependent methyltransferase [Bacteroidia bacterium]|nr:class I SAM-dependent methyltransferase [Bacteroidia bacterium]
MDEQQLQSIAAQLRQPHGDFALQVGEMMNTGNLHMNLGAIEAVKPTAGDNILEIGMGNGFFVPKILSVDDTIRYTGCDFSEMMVEESRKRNEAYVQNERAQFLLCSADALPFAEETFDKAFSVNTVYFWENQQAVLAEIHRVLKPKGQITLAIRPKSIMQHYPFVKYGFNMFTKEDLINLLTENHFRVTDAVEKDEPETEIGGVKLKVAMVVVSAEKQEK